jgi:hypothetical protein
MALLIGSCGGGGSSGGGPTTPPSASTPPPSGNNPTVTITAAGAVSPKNIDLPVASGYHDPGDSTNASLRGTLTVR